MNRDRTQLVLYSGPKRREALPDVTVEKGL
jgi:hypothetical protein